MSGGYFDARYGSSENEALLGRINAYRPDLLMVGMGMPRQEIWTQENFARLNADVILSSIGAAFDYIAGAVPTPPRWSGRMGLEWFFRLAHEPAGCSAAISSSPGTSCCCCCWTIRATAMAESSSARRRS